MRGLYATKLSVCLLVCLLQRIHKNAVLSKDKQFRAVVSIDD